MKIHIALSPETKVMCFLVFFFPFLAMYQVGTKWTA